MDQRRAGIENLFSRNEANDLKAETAPACLEYVDLQLKPIPETDGMGEIHRDCNRGNATAIGAVHLCPVPVQTGVEKIFDGGADHVEKARVIDNSCRIAMLKHDPGPGGKRMHLSILLLGGGEMISPIYVHINMRVINKIAGCRNLSDHHPQEYMRLS